MAMTDLWIPIPLVLHVLKEPDPELMKCVQYGVIVFGVAISLEQMPSTVRISSPLGRARKSAYP
jgi:hypothetical protein